jgi:hypothetical protein
MAYRKQLKDKNGNVVYPDVGVLGTYNIADGAVTSDKIDYTTLDTSNIPLSSVTLSTIFTPATGFSISPNSRVFRIGSIYFGYVGIVGTVPAGSTSATVGTFKYNIKNNTVNIGQAGDSQWNPMTNGAIIYNEPSNGAPSMLVRVSATSSAIRWWFYADLTDTPFGQ